TGRALMDATSSVSQSLIGLVEPAVLYFHRKAFERALREDLLLHLLEEVRGEPPAVPGRMVLTTMFVDLSSFTTLTSTRGDEAGAHMLDRFSTLVRHAAWRHAGTGPHAVSYSALGAQHLKGIPDYVDLFDAQPTTAANPSTSG